MCKRSLLLITFVVLTTALIVVTNACAPIVTSAPPSSLPPANNLPEISQVIAPGVITALAPAEITCKASDPDGDLLAYNWITGTGNITGSGATVIWIAPPVAGTYTITAVVSDGRGGEVNKSVTIDVSNIVNKPPEINKILVTKMDKTELTVLAGDVRPVLTRPWNVITLECFADDPEKGELSYKWKSAGGKIEGDGKAIKFVPIEKEEIIVTVTVTDGRGSSTKADIHFYADCCGHYPPGTREF